MNNRISKLIRVQIASTPFLLNEDTAQWPSVNQEILTKNLTMLIHPDLEKSRNPEL